MGKGKTSAERVGEAANIWLAQIAKDEYAEREPLLDTLIGRSESFLDTGDISGSKYLDPIKNSVADQLAVAQNSAIGNMPVGGAMFEELNNQFLQGGQSIIDNVLMREYGDALTLGTGGAPIAIQGLGAVGGNAASIAGAQAQRAAAEGNNANMMMGGGMCCFIFIAGHGYLHPIVRRYRDNHMTVRNRRGYYWLADRLVPKMEKHKWAKTLVRCCMIDPMTSYGKYYYGYGKIGVIFKPLSKAWLRVFDLLGDRSPYRRRGTLEVV